MAKKPVIYAGQGVIAFPEGPKLLAELAEKCKIPVCTTVHGLGGFDELNELSLHMLGMHGSPYANLAMQDSDLIIALGARFDDRVTGSLGKFAPQAKAAEKEGRGGIVHFEIMPKNIVSCSSLLGNTDAQLYRIRLSKRQKLWKGMSLRIWLCFFRILIKCLHAQNGSPRSRIGKLVYPSITTEEHQMA